MHDELNDTVLGVCAQEMKDVEKHLLESDA